MALDDITVSFDQGKIHSVIGRSGAGKSTLIRCLNFLEPLDSGQMILLGQTVPGISVTDQRLLLKKIGTVFQKVNLLSRKTALENVMLSQEWQGVPKANAQLQAKELLAKVGLAGLEDRYPSQLSGGQCQRVAIARALANDAQILLCDEFTSALDPETSLDILALLRQLNQNLGVTIILITHDMAVVREISDFVYVMDGGQIVEQNDVEQVLLHPQHPTTKSLLTGLFVKDLPLHLQQALVPDPVEGDAVIRLVFSGKASQHPVISDFIQEYQIPLNILAGNLDHLRTTVFGTLLISIPYQDKTQNKTYEIMRAHFAKHGVSAEILGYLPKREGGHD
jgi:D-methionine transport system ATP-binding protein